MNSIIKPTLCALALGVCGASPLCAASATASCEQTHSVLYAGGVNQAIMKIKVTAPETSQILKGMTFSMAGTTSVADIAKAQIFASAATPYFSPNSDQANRRAIPILNTISKGAKTLQFEGGYPLSPGDNYFWLCVDLIPRARGLNKVDAACTGIALLEDSNIAISNPSPEGCAQVYPYQFRVVPYYRHTNLMQWNRDQLNAQHFKSFTDLIYFNVGCDTDGNLTGQNNEQFLNGLDKLKNLRGNAGSKIILGVAHCDAGMTAITADPEKRVKFARQLVSFAEEKGFDGIDIDWEYPDNDTQWYHFSLFLGEVRSAMGANGMSLSSAINPYYLAPTSEMMDLLDFVNVMSYDRGGQHSTYPDMVTDVNTMRNKNVPDCKIVMGLPFYTNETRSNRNWDAQKGYSTVIQLYPNIAPGTDTCTIDGQEHYFNGITTIKKKCQYVKTQKLGGVMIWCYD
ncbi:glycosyl hydrolase family 18 protein, partial [uncultured Akkermansia sp.]